MTLPAGGSLAMSDIRGEFGGTIPDSLSEYYKGGGLVPNEEATGDIPSSGRISFSDFFDTSAILDPPIGVGELLLSHKLTSTAFTPRTGSNTGYVYSTTYNFNALHNDASYRVDWYMTATANYDFTYGRIYVIVNNTNVYTGYLGAGPTLSSWQDSYFRDYSGTRSINSGTLTLGFGDSVEVKMYVNNRLQSSGNYLHYTDFYFEVERIA